MDRSVVKTIKNDEKFLRQKSTPINFKDKNLQKYVDLLEEFCITNEVLAMAAVQLGIPKRIIYLKNTDLERINMLENEELNAYNEAKILINPVIIKKEGLTEYWEACASCLNNMGLVKRPYKIVVDYCDIKGAKHQVIFKGFESTVLSHEMDHLDGILHIDIAEKVLVMPKEERKEFRKKHDYKIISKTGDYEKLLKS